MRFRGLSTACWLAAVLLVASGCGDDDGPDASTAAPTTDAPSASESVETTDDEAAAPVEADVTDSDESTTDDAATATEADPADEAVLPVTITDHVGNEVTIDSIERIIPLDGTVAEVVFALGLGDNVVATDLSATYPEAADTLPKIGYQRALSAETIAAYAPTVLIATEIAGPEGTIDDLRRLGYPLVIVPNEATPEGPSEKIRAVASALGVEERGEALATSLEAQIDATAAPADDGPVVVALYLRGEGTQFVLGEASATHWLIEAAGGTDVADVLGLGDGAQVNAEAILAAAPDIILVPSAGLDSVGGMEGIMDVGGLGETPAGQNGAVISIDDQLLLGNGPRTGDLLEDLRTAFEEYANQ